MLLTVGFRVYLDLQSTQRNSPYIHHFVMIKAFILSTLQVQVTYIMLPTT